MKFANSRSSSALSPRVSLAFGEGAFMMYYRVFITGVAIAFLSASARSEDEPKLVDTTERLTADEEKLTRQAVYDNNITTASPDRANPFNRVFITPKVLKSLYQAKPKATVRILLKIVEGGRGWDSLHAVCCIEALVMSPEYAVITAEGTNPKEWDDVQAKQDTNRDLHRRICVKLIADKEQDTVPKGK
jgi:hypothetical protein